MQRLVMWEVVALIVVGAIELGLAFLFRLNLPQTLTLVFGSWALILLIVTETIEFLRKVFKVRSPTEEVLKEISAHGVPQALQQNMQQVIQQ